MAKVTCRFRAQYSLTLVWSSETVDFESWKSSSTFHRALLRLTGLVEDQDPAVGAEVPGQERAHRIARSVLVPAGAIEQVVQAVGPIQADCLRDRPAVSRDLRHQQSTQTEQAVRPQVAAMVDRRQVRRELGECRFHQFGIYTGGAGRPVFVMRHNIMITGRPARAQSPWPASPTVHPLQHNVGDCASGQYLRPVYWTTMTSNSPRGPVSPASSRPDSRVRSVKGLPR